MNQIPVWTNVRRRSPKLQKLVFGLMAVSCIQPVYAIAETAALPPILNYHPSCQPFEIKEITQSQFVNDYKNGDIDRADAARADLLQSIRQKAASQGADALLLKEISRLAKYGASRTGQHRLKITATASLIKFCNDNSELSNRPTRWDEHGILQMQEKQTRTSLSTISGTFHSTKSAASPEPPTVLPPLSQDVSLENGIFAVHPGMSRAQVEQLYGVADAEIQLQSGHTALGYGRQLWLIFSDTLLQIQTQKRFLSGYGQNLLELHPHFDTQGWVLASKINYKSSIADVRRQLPDATETGSDQLQLSNGQRQLLLTFEKYNLVHQQPAELLLTGFILKHARQNLVSLEAPAVKPELVKSVLQQVQPTEVQQSVLWSSLTIPDPLPQHLLKTANGPWRILGDYLQLQIDNGQLIKLRIADSIFYRPGQPSTFHEYYQALGLPVQKQQLQTLFSDGELYHQQFNLYRDSFHLQINFDSDADDAKPEEVILSYY